MNEIHGANGTARGRLGMSVVKLLLAVVTAAGIVPAIGASPIQASTVGPAWSQTELSCSCVLYVRSRTGLPGGPATAAGYTQNVMWNFGYKRVTPTAGAILVWDAWQKGAYGAGHMAIIRSAYYNGTTKKWVIAVDQANWGGCSIRHNYTFAWGDLYGVNAYVRR